MEKIDIAQIDIEGEIHRIGELYGHYKSLYKKIAFLCCSEENKKVKSLKASYRRELKTLERMKADGHKVIYRRGPKSDV